MIDFDNGMSIKQVRAYYQLDVPHHMRVPDYCKRPPCGRCGARVSRRSYSHTVFGLICHACEYGYKLQLEPPLLLMELRSKAKRPKKNRWDNYKRKITYCECGKPKSEARAKRCWTCEMNRRRRTQPPQNATDSAS